MAKNIVVFSDGTGNSAAKVLKTNVWRTYQALDLSKPDQIAAYDDGVGTSSFQPYALLGGALGVGLARNVMHLYAFICRNYQPGDHIYAFGFSRGAFTIRILAGLICDQGLLPWMPGAELPRQVKNAYRAFRRNFTTMLRVEAIPRAIRDAGGRTIDHLRGRRAYTDVERITDVPIEFLGLWDTVDAYGLPIDEMTRAWDLYFWPLTMRERNLSSKVQRACHALSIDDERQTFHPVLWNELGDRKKDPIHVYQPQNATHVDDEVISQVWFSGMHANVGGGYADDALSFVPLDWMLARAMERGLRFKPEATEEVREAARRGLKFKSGAVNTLTGEATAFGRIYDSRQGAGSYYRYAPRRIDLLTNDTADPKNPVVIGRPKIHESVFERLRAGSDRYAPIVLPITYAVVKNNGDIVENAYETPAEAAARFTQQEKAWNLVWKRRVSYLLTLAVTLVAVLMPLLATTHADGAAPGRLGVLSPIVGFVGTFLPGFLSPWIYVYRSNPRILLGLSAILFFLMGWSSSLEVQLLDQMRRVWSHVTGRTRQVTETRPGSLVTAVRASEKANSLARIWRRTVVPTIVAAAFVLVGALGLNRVVVALTGSFGEVCSEDPPTPQRTFDTSNPCWASGNEVKEGKRYRIKLTMPEAGWIDGCREGDCLANGCGPHDGCLRGNVHGLRTDEPVHGKDGNAKFPWLMTLAVPLRRQIGQPWFQPIARIGRYGEDEYPLLPTVPGDGSPTTLLSEFTARTSGKLFLYVNDAAVLSPRFGCLEFYTNNRGTAAFEIKEVTATW